MEHLRTELARKGWSAEEIADTHRILTNPELQEKHSGIRRDMQFVLYWGTLMVLLVCNLVVAMVLVPVLIIFTPAYMALILFIVGAAFGLFFHLLINDIEHIETIHHTAARVFIPLVAVGNIFLMHAMARAVAERLNIPLKQHPFWMIASYVIAFLLPSLLADMFVKGQKSGQLK